MFRSIGLPLKRTGVRCYSNDSNNSIFLSDLFKRIEQVTAKAKDVKPLASKPKDKAERPKANFNKKKPFPKKTGGPNTTAKSPSAPAQTQSTSTPKPNVIKVQDHSLMNSFGQSYAQFATTGAAPRSGAPRSRNAGFKPRSPRAPNSAATGTATSPDAGRPAPRKNNTRPVRTKVLEQKDGKAPSKNLTAVPLVPELNGDTFFYGKITSVNPGVSSRVASVAKEALLKSKYPYLVPRNIIASLAKDGHQKNQFLVQNNYSLKVNRQEFFSRFDTVVKGKIQEIEVGAAKGDQAGFTKSEIMKNGSLDLHNKQALFDLVNGLKSPKDMFANAAWKK